MQKLILSAIAILTIAASARAELTPEQFGKVKNWANREGYMYRGLGGSGGVTVFMFENLHSNLLAYAPVSSDTPDEAINALIGSSALYRQALISAKRIASEERAKAYREGYIDGSQLVDPVVREERWSREREYRASLNGGADWE